MIAPGQIGSTAITVSYSQTWKRGCGQIGSAYCRIFSVNEISSDISLKWLSGAILIGFLDTFARWLYSPLTTVKSVANGSHVCWPFFQSCDDLIFLSALPDGYSQTTVYMLLFGIMTGGVYAMYRGRWTAVHLAILVLFVVKLYFQLINYSFKGNFDYYHNLFCIIYLFSSHKKFFCRLGLVSLYFLSTASKITSSWILGEYFTALKTGLPIFPRGTEPVMTNLVIGMEMVGSWFLFNRTRFVQRAVLGFFVIFHLYSGILVGYHYPTIVLPPLLILFGPWFDASGHHVPLDRTAIVGWSVVSSLLLLQFIPHLIEGDERLTLEGNFFGVYMFEANHQCYGTITRDNEVVERFSEANAWRRCDPYAVWMRAKQAYCSDKESKYRLAFNHSINGEPFREIVNEPDLCRLKYYPFSRNTWIKDEKAAPAVGRPVQNFYR